MKQRTFYLDNVCCVLILHMIYTYHIAHSCGGFKPTVVVFIGTTLSFFMSWFFFKGGMMHKDTSTKQILHKSIKRLLVPFLIFLLIGLLLDGWIQYTKNIDFVFVSFIKGEIVTFLTFALLWPTGASWFLLSLFIARICFNILQKRIHPIIISIVFACFAYAIYIMNCHDWEFRVFIPGHNSYLDIPTFYMGNMCHGLSVYSLGYWLKEKQFHRTIFVLALALFVLKYIIPAGIDFRANNSYDTNFMLSVLYGMSGCVVINNFFKRFCNKRLPIITYIGRNSMVYYLVHFPVMYVTTCLFWDSFENKDLWIRFVVLSSIVTISLILADYLFRVKKIRFLIGG